MAFYHGSAIMGAMLRALLSLVASCYIVAALVFPGFWLLNDLRLPPPAWWPVYLVLELVLVGVPVCAAVWELVWRPMAAFEATRPSHLMRLIGRTLAVVYGFLIVPAACFIALPHRANLYAGFLTFAAAALVTIVYLRSGKRV